MNTYKDVGFFITAKIYRFFTVSFDWLRFIWFACKIGTHQGRKMHNYKIFKSWKNLCLKRRQFSLIYVLVIEVCFIRLQMHCCNCQHKASSWSKCSQEAIFNILWILCICILHFVQNIHSVTKVVQYRGCMWMIYKWYIDIFMFV